MSESRLLEAVSAYAAEFLPSLADRPVGPSATYDELMRAFGGPLPAAGADDLEVIASLIREGESGLIAIPSGRYFGFVIGGSHPAALAADWLTSVWDQNAGLYACGPDGRGRRGGRGRVAARATRPSRRGLVRVRDRLPARACHLSRGRAAARARTGRLGRERGWDGRQSGDSRARRGRGARHRAAGAAIPRHRHALARLGALGRAGARARRRAARRPRLCERSHDRVSAGRQRQHRGSRSGGRDRRRRA